MRMGGIKIGGYNRTALTKFLDDALFHMWENAVSRHGGPDAAVIMFTLIQHDPKFRPPHWLMLRLRAHRKHILATLYGKDR
jgi:hypothetical protein